MSYNQTKKQVGLLLLLLTILCFNGCNHRSTEASMRCGTANNSDTICEINVTSISGEADYLTFTAPPSLKDVSLSIELYHQEGGGVNIWIENSEQHITKLIHSTDKVTLKESWKLSGQAKVEEEFGKSVFKIYIEPRRELFFKKAKNVRMILRYKTKLIIGLSANENMSKAIKYIQTKEFKQARILLEQESKKGNAEAQYDLGVIYHKGYGVKQDYKKAREFWKKSANQGFSMAQYNLGVMYANAQGVTQDYKKAIKLYQKSANQGYALAQYNLGVMYAKGQGVKQNYKKAIELYQKSANQGFADAQSNLGFMYDMGKGVKQDYQKAIELYKKSANQGYAPAQYNLNILCQKYSGICTQ